MNSQIIRWARRGAIVLLVTPLVAAAADGKVATLKGRVVDEVTGDGLPLVDVAVKAGRKALPATSTDATGRYVVTDVPAGAYTLEFSKAGFEYNPTPVKGKASAGEVVLSDVPLVEKNASSDDYYRRLAEKDVQRAQTSPGDRDAYAKSWNRLEQMGIAPSGRAAYAQTLTRLVPDVDKMKLRKLRDYSAVNPAAVRKFQVETDSAVRGEKPLIDKTELKRRGLNDAVIVDVGANALHKTTASAEAKQQFVGDFGRNYGKESEDALVKKAPAGSRDAKSGTRGSERETHSSTTEHSQSERRHR